MRVGGVSKNMKGDCTANEPNSELDLVRHNDSARSYA